MEEHKKKRGGPRPGSGRPKTGRNVSISVRISPEAADLFSKVENKSKFLDELIKSNLS